ncbi:MAG: O-antigen ligase family protein, partial [Caldilineaceae bacterium]|nr:O-antigen ligase family protein [Caldilineaceae bacterium]
RGAWIGLAAGAIVAAYLLLRHAFVARRPRTPAWLVLLDVAVVAVAVAAIAFFVAVVLSPDLDARFGVSAQGGSAFSRIALWRDSLPLIQDYYFTGSGLASTAMIYATYAYLLHVPYLVHAHNLYVQIALEQGVPGLIAFLGIIVSTVAYTVSAWRRTDEVGRGLLAAGYAATIALLVHGLFDAELYFSTLAPLVFLAPTLLLWVASGMYRHARSDDWAEPVPAGRSAGLAIGAGLPVLVALLLPGTPARWEANVGSALQSRTELSIYHQPEWSFQDQVRRQLPNDLAAAEEHFQAALALDPAQPTANR